MRTFVREIAFSYIMINRILIRLKIIQLVYAFYQNGGKKLDVAEKDLLYSLHKAYELYHIMLLLPVAITRYAGNRLTQRKQLNQVTHREENLDTRFVDNAFVKQLERNRQLKKFHSTLAHTWDDESAYLQQLYKDIVESVYYKEYMERPSTDYATDRELWCLLFKHLVMKDERIDEILEDQNLYWNDDRTVVDTFVLKTMRRIEEEQEPNVPLMPEFKDDADQAFAIDLFRASISNDNYYRNLISGNLRNWEFNRLAYMDVIIMQVALAEILEFPFIPVAVSINEYVELAKCYSTPNSGSYVNGILDAVCRRLDYEGVLQKEMPESDKAHLPQQE